MLQILCIISKFCQSFKKPSFSSWTIVCIGSAIVDIEVISTEETKEPKKGEISYFPAEIKQRAGGVARNHAEALARLGIDVDLISAFGVDLNGDPDIGATFLFKKLEGLENLVCLQICIKIIL
ncbi:unnamed protein product [Meloidogyne enterolobii]|uniref:Uncharacterized protein n=1 Tax=Meloidogyne enterolobii TaxID=390850 RepID=A0ACB0YAZ1_MELEN